MKDGLSDEDRAHSKALIEAEVETDADPTIPPGKRAKIYVCYAHDWYQMDMDEEGGRLLLKADQVYPGYFKGLVIQHTKESKDFDKLVKNITLELTWMILTRLGDKKP